ncbi:cytochrome P450 71D8 [Amborella trichopoda]|nr:cytochrome P450 71D8 [Amborella trichopoda]|eukprot:XP_020530433.1 cytochrome P450 71D8 [Amborella trichopoda]
MDNEKFDEKNELAKTDIFLALDEYVLLNGSLEAIMRFDSRRKFDQESSRNIFTARGRSIERTTSRVLGEADIAEVDSVMTWHARLDHLSEHILKVEAIHTSCSIINRSPSVTINYKTPKAVCTSKPVDHSFLRVFREEETTHLMESIAEASFTHINLTERIFSVASSIVERADLRKKYVGDEFRDIIRETIQLSSGFDIEDLYPSMGFLGFLSSTRSKMEKVHRQLDCFLDKVIEEYVRSGRKHEGEQGDLVYVLLRLQEECDAEVELTKDNIKAILMDIFVGGIETTFTTLTWAMAELMKNPKVMEKAQSEMRHPLKGKAKVEESDLDLKETLRLHPPAPLLVPRESMEKCPLEGYEIPVKTRVLMNAWAIGRRHDVYKNAEKFEPERFSDSLLDYKGQRFDYIPFRGGRRGCPGALFAMATAQLALAQLLYCFDWKLAHGMKP